MLKSKFDCCGLRSAHAVFSKSLLLTAFCIILTPMILSGAEPEGPIVFDASNEFPLHCLAFSCDSKLIASGNPIIRVWSIDDPAKAPLQFDHGHFVNAIAFSSEASKLVTAGGDGILRVWDLRSGKQIEKIEAGGTVTRVTFLDNDRLLRFKRGSDGTTFDWDLNTREKQQLPKDDPTFIKTSPDGRYRIRFGGRGHDDRWLELLDCQSGERVHKLSGHRALVNDATFDPTGRYVASGSGSVDQPGSVVDNQGEVRIWDARSGSLVQVIDTGRYAVRALRFSPDGKYLAAAAEGKMLLWNWHPSTVPNDKPEAK